MTIVWLLVLIACLAGTSFSSRRAVTSAMRVAESLTVSPAVIGLTVMSIGTDLPEIANSLVSTASGHGDVNVGDSMGSALTQVTLTLGILCLAGGTITTDRTFVVGVGAATVVSVTIVRLLAGDGDLVHRDGLLLMAMWLIGTALLGRKDLRSDQMLAAGRGQTRSDIITTLGWLAAIGVLAIGVVESFLRIADAFGVPEFIGSFVALSIGTSLPELFVDWTAIRRGASSMAIGDVFGSSFVDATLSIGIGPAVFSSQVSPDALTGTVIAAGAILMATVLVAMSRTYGRRLGVALLVLYGSVQTTAVLIGG